MSVLIEGISVVLKLETLEAKYPGGTRAYIDNAPNSTICSDAYLARIGFMDPADVRSFVAELEEHGLVFIQNGIAVDVAVVDQLRGPTAPVSWMDCSKLKSGEVSITVCYDKRDDNVGHVIMPLGWTYENSLSKQMKFVPNAELETKMTLVRNEYGVDIYRHPKSGRRYMVGRSKPKNSASNPILDQFTSVELRKQFLSKLEMYFSSSMKEAEAHNIHCNQKCVREGIESWLEQREPNVPTDLDMNESMCSKVIEEVHVECSAIFLAKQRPTGELASLFSLYWSYKVLVEVNM